MSEPTTLTTIPPTTAAAPVAVAPPAAATPPAAPAADPAAELAQLREQTVADRFDAVAARAGIDETYTEVALELFRKTGQEPSKANLTKFCADLKKNRPALFGGPQPASTAPTPPHAVPSAPAPGAVSNPYQQWQALRAAGRAAEAEAFYQRHRRAIQRAAG